MLTRLKELREDRDLKQEDVYKIGYISINSYRRYENNQRDIPCEVIIKFAEFYNVSVDYLLCLTDTQKPYPRKNKK